MTTKKKNLPRNPITPISSDGYTPIKERAELAGYWVPEAGPLHGKLVEAFQFIQKSGKGRGGTRTVFVFDLAEPCIARVKGAGPGETDQLEARELVGVIASFGLMHLVQYGGCFVKIARGAKKTLGNGNEAWSYDLSFKGTAKPLDVRPPMTVAPTNGSTPAGTDEDVGDELPF